MQLNGVKTSQDLVQLDCLNHVNDLMLMSGCDLPLLLEKIPPIVDCLITYDALYKRKRFFDALGDGLEVYKLTSAIRLFPHLFRPAFTSSGSCSTNDVSNILKFPSKMTAQEKGVAGYLNGAIRKLTIDGMLYII